MASCSSLQQTSVNDDIYFSPKDELTSDNVYKNPTYDKNQTVSLNKDNDKEFSRLLENDVQNDTLKESENPYESVVVDDYDEAYERRMDAMKSPYYGMNNNYYNIYLSDDYWYAMSYMNDPFYNVVIVGDRIWVEPYWMSSWWGYRPSYYYGYYGYGSPYYNNYYGYHGYYGYHSSWYNPYYYNGYYDPYYYRNYSYDGKKNVNYRRSLVTGSPTRNSLSGSTRELPETYMGRDIRSSSTVKTGIDRGTVTDTRTKSAVLRDEKRNNLAGETIRVRNTNSNQSGSAVRSTSTRGQSEPNRSYTRPQQSSRSSSYSSPARSTRYSRPQSTGSSSRGSSYSGTTKSSTYTPTRSGSSRSGNSGSGSSYTPRRSSGSSGSSYRGSSSGSSRSSGSSYKSSGSTRSSGSSGSSRSSGSSSSSGSSRGGRR